MPAYRGVDQKKILSSLQDGEAFLRRLNMGPAIGEELDHWLASDPFSKIAKASTDEELRDAINETGSEYAFLRTREVFEYHAVLDDDVAQTYYQLGKWGVFSGMMTMELRQSDVEQRDHVVEAQKTKPVTEKQIQKIRENFAGPFKQCGIHMPHAPTKNLQAAAEPIVTKLLEVLEPFQKAGDVQMVGVGFITEDRKLGVSFVATDPAIEAVAKAFPDEKIFSYSGKEIKAKKAPISNSKPKF